MLFHLIFSISHLSAFVLAKLMCCQKRLEIGSWMDDVVWSLANSI